MSYVTIGILIYLLAIVLMIGGIVSVALSYLLYKVPAGHALVSRRAKQGRLLAGQWTVFVQQPGHLVTLKKETLSFPNGDKYIDLRTPDDGVIGVKVSVTFSPDYSTGTALDRYAASVKDLGKILEARVQSALYSWINGKPLPGTLKRAVTMKDEAEHYVRAKITSIPPKDALIVHNDPTLYYGGGYPVPDLGVCVHEVHLIEMQTRSRGTGRADWGDGMEGLFNADKVINQFKAAAHNLSELESLYNALTERYPNQAEDIKDIYFDVRSRFKERR